jgi:hypothetical protein
MRTAVLAVTAVATLALAGIAIAHGFDSKSVQSVSATFTATTATNVQSSTCTGSNGHTYTTTNATYTGATAGASDPSLAGPITLETRALVDTTTGDGTISARLRITTSAGTTDAAFDAVVHGTSVAGLAEGHASSPHSALIANVSASWTAAGGFTGGMIGGGTGAGYAVEVTEPGGCTPPPAPKPDRVEVHGAITAITATGATASISAAGVTCTIPAALQAKVAALGLAVGDRVELHCTTAGGTTTLDRLEASGHHGGQGNEDHSRRHR